MANTQFELEAVYDKMVEAQRPWDIFGQLSGTKAEQVRLVRTIYHQLAKILHPDRYIDNPLLSHMANEGMRALNEYYTLAQAQLNNGTYGQERVSHVQKPQSSFEFVAKGITYRMFEPIAVGDFCQVFSGERTVNGVSGEVVFKIPYDVSDNDLMSNEAHILSHIKHKSIPVFIDTFTLTDGRQVNVLRYIKGFDLVGVRARFANGLPLSHGVWIFDRLLSVVGYLHMNGVLHGAISPANVMVTPENHNGLLLDFVLAVPEAHKDGARYLGVNDFSAPELKTNTKSRPHPTADMYSLGLTMLYLLGGDILNRTPPDNSDPRFDSFLSGFLEVNPEARYNDAWKAWHVLKELRKEIFGASSQFLPLYIS